MIMYQIDSKIIQVLNENQDNDESIEFKLLITDIACDSQDVHGRLLRLHASLSKHVV